MLAHQGPVLAPLSHLAGGPDPLLRIDKWYQRVALHLVCRLITMKGTIVYYSFSERVYFSLFHEIYIILIGQHLREL